MGAGYSLQRTLSIRRGQQGEQQPGTRVSWLRTGPVLAAGHHARKASPHSRLACSPPWTPGSLLSTLTGSLPLLPHPQLLKIQTFLPSPFKSIPAAVPWNSCYHEQIQPWTQEDRHTENWSVTTLHHGTPVTAVCMTADERIPFDVGVPVATGDRASEQVAEQCPERAAFRGRRKLFTVHGPRAALLSAVTTAQCLLCMNQGVALPGCHQHVGPGRHMWPQRRGCPS